MPKPNWSFDCATPSWLSWVLDQPVQESVHPLVIVAGLLDFPHVSTNLAPQSVQISAGCMAQRWL
jgi:hypothetical protein